MGCCGWSFEEIIQHLQEEVPTNKIQDPPPPDSNTNTDVVLQNLMFQTIFNPPTM